MSQNSIMWPTSTTGDGASKITDAQWREVLRRIFLNNPTTQGVVRGRFEDEELGCSAGLVNEYEINVQQGGAFVQGFFYWNDDDITVTLPIPALGATGFRIVLRATWGTTRTVRATYIMSNEGVASLPTVTQVDGTLWEISLASGVINTDGTIAGGDVTDTRTYAHYNTKVSTGMLDDDAVTNAKIADDAVDTAQIADDAVGTAQIADDAVTSAQIADDAVGTAQIAANAVGASEIAAEAVGTSELADESVTFEKAGTGIIQLPTRQGTSETDWQDAGTDTIDVGQIRMHVGARNLQINAGNPAALLQNITYPTAYADKPAVFVQVVSTSTQVIVWQVEGITAADFDVRVTRKDEADDAAAWTVLILWHSYGDA